MVQVYGVMEGAEECPRLYLQEGRLEGVVLLGVVLLMLDAVHSKIAHLGCLLRHRLGQTFYRVIGPGVLRQIF